MSSRSSAIQIPPSDSLPQELAVEDRDLLMWDAERLARHMLVSVTKLAEMRRAGLIIDPAIEVGRILRWSRAELEAWALAGSPPADDWRRMRATTGRPRK